MNKRTRDILYPIISQRDGDYCKCCGKLPREANLVLDHKDNDNTNNSHTNLQILCRACNYMKNPRKEPLDMCVSENEDKVKGSCLLKSEISQPIFREFILEEIDNTDCQMIEWKDAIDMGAEKANISQTTAKRYLEKMITKYGPLILRESSGYKGIARRHLEDAKNPPQIYQW